MRLILYIYIKIYMMMLKTQTPVWNGVCMYPLTLTDVSNGIFHSHWQVEAYDADSGEMGQVLYSIVDVSNDGVSKFDIDPESGQIYVTQDVERNTQYILTVMAQDQDKKFPR